MADAILGKIVKDFTVTEDILRNVGSYIDKLVAAEDENEFEQIVVELCFKLSSLQSCVASFESDVRSYIIRDKDSQE